jgi:hypothetical protein
MRPVALFLITIAFLLLPSCSKTKRTEYPFPEDLKPYCIFKKGSYWIYRNDLTGTEDSSILLSTPTINPTPYSETGPIAYYLNNYFEGGIIAAIRVSFFWRGTEYRLHNRFSHDPESASIVSGHIVKGYSEIDEDDNFNYRVLGIDDTLTIGDTVYHGVLTTQFARLRYPNSDSVKYTYFFDKVHGLVRFVRGYGGADTTWSLKRSLILR